MEAQHRAVLGRLRAGTFDEAIRERLGAVLDDPDPRASTRPTETAPPVETTEPPAPARRNRAARRSRIRPLIRRGPSAKASSPPSRSTR